MRPYKGDHLQTLVTTLIKGLTELWNVAMKTNETVNEPESELTYEKLKTYKGFENITEPESVKYIESIKKLAKILFYLYEHEQQTELKTDSDESRP